ncbi:hypothetical protein BV898_00291 [Hypsibius exemplaris]|uniref:Apple domain-containing protein n=1 Tax=Hypsibius exemplaris TaxID=2072580 RepID=A0A1W0XFA9_HYPEX|nr:hypothetical protein BV898_00291 [Hypsibius exemplaris]
MALIFLLLGVVLLANGRVALSIDATRGSVSDDFRNLADVVPDFESVVEAVGWGIFIPANSISRSTINLGVAANRRGCLSKCITREIPGCRLVSFDLNTRVCTGWNQHMEGTFVPDAGNTLLAISAKQFQQRSGVHFWDHATFIYGADGRPVANGDNVKSMVKLQVWLLALPWCSFRPRSPIFPRFFLSFRTSFFKQVFT